MEKLDKRKPLPFEPSQARFFQKSIPNKRVGQPGRKMMGPYWYAAIKVDGVIKHYYIGKELPEELKPFIPVDAPEVAQNSTVQMAYDNLRRTLERGNQVIIDIGQICRVCGAEYLPLSQSRFLLYKED